ncbi:hypothetical protein QG37_08332 [Candidozyma auris]|nr:hypothetical protein QG37_08332 [[Candida] auris]
MVMSNQFYIFIPDREQNGKVECLIVLANDAKNILKFQRVFRSL